MKEHNKNLNIPNALSVFRIILILPFIIFFMQDNILMAAIVVFLAGISDFLDGVIARHFNQSTELGQILDPLADKLSQITVVVCLAIKYSVLIPLAAILMLKELCMIIASAILLKRKMRPPKAKWYGKIATTVFYTSATVIVGLKGIFGIENTAVNIALLSVTVAFMLFAFGNYLVIFLHLIKNKETKEDK